MWHEELLPIAATFTTCSTWSRATVIGTDSMGSASLAHERYIWYMLTVRGDVLERL